MMRSNLMIPICILALAVGLLTASFLRNSSGDTTSPAGAPDATVAQLVSVDGELTEEPVSFKDVVAQPDKTVLVDFYADWCGPCKAMMPAVHEFVASSPDVIVLKVNVDAAPAVASHFNVRAIPDIRVFRNGRTVYSAGGMHSLNDLQLAASR